MVSALKPLIDDITRLRGEFLDRVEALSPEQRELKSTPTDWSATQVTAHLKYYDSLAVSTFEEAKSKKLRPGFKAKFFIWFVTKGMSGSRRIPTGPGGEPTGNDSYESVKAQWEADFSAIVSRLQEISEDEGSFGFVINPLAGPLSPEQYLRLTAAHLEYHLRHFPDPR